MFLISKDLYEVRKTKNRGRGTFAKKDIEAGAVIGDYLGTAMHPEDISEEKHGLYDMYITDDLSILAAKFDDGIHLINHSCSPNCNMYIYNHHVLYYASRKIFKGEEITVDYCIGGLEDEKVACTHECFCGSKFCRGTMHNAKYVEDRWDRMYEEAERKATIPLTYKFNKYFEPLPLYPKIIKDDGEFDIFANFDLRPISYDETRMPSTQNIRLRIRTTGRGVKLPKLGQTVWGILNKYYVTT